MNLQNLLDKQRELDAHILEKHPVGAGDDRLAKKILAFQTELGECANEWRGFKFWSDDQKPKGEGYYSPTEKEGYTHIYCGECDAFMDVDHELAECNKETMVHLLFKNPLLEEYVDCLHFLLSIGLEIGVQKLTLNDNLSNPKVFADKPIVIRFSHLMSGAASLLNGTTHTLGDIYVSVFGGLVKLGYQLGFTWEQIETAYFEKNAVNRQRQDAGY